MTTQDARERAWEMYRETFPNLTWSEFAMAYDEGLAAGKREDEQRIVELGIPGPEECTCHAAYKDRGLVAPDCAYHEYEELFEALRALGQSEEVENG